jgi:hypothetical protein
MSPDSHRRTLRQNILISGRSAEYAPLFEQLRSEGVGTVKVQPDSIQTLWRGLSVLGSLPPHIRTTPFEQVRRVFLISFPAVPLLMGCLKHLESPENCHAAQRRLLCCQDTIDVVLLISHS